MRYGKDYAERIDFGQGLVLRVRVVRPSDKPLLAAGFARLSRASRHQRFLGAKAGLTDEELRQLTEFDGENHYAIAAIRLGESDAEIEGVAVARFARDDVDPDVAELAIVVLDEWQRRGIGHCLLERIVTAAAERRIQRIRARILADNAQALEVLSPHMHEIDFHSEDGVMTLEYNLPPMQPPERWRTGFDAFLHVLRLVARGVVVIPVRLAGGLPSKGSRAAAGFARTEPH